MNAENLKPPHTFIPASALANPVTFKVWFIAVALFIVMLEGLSFNCKEIEAVVGPVVGSNVLSVCNEKINFFFTNSI